MNWTGIPVSYTLAWVADFWKMVSEYDYLQSGSLRARVKKYLLNLSIKKIRVISKNRIKINVTAIFNVRNRLRFVENWDRTDRNLTQFNMSVPGINWSFVLQ